MKKLYIIVLCLAIILGLWSRSGETSRNTQQPENSFSGGPAVPQPGTSSISNQAVMADSDEYNVLHKTYLKDKSLLSVMLKSNALYLTSTTSSSIKVNFIMKSPTSVDDSTKLLVNADNTLPTDFSPKQLNEISASKIKLEYSKLKLIPSTLNALYSMAEAAKKESVKGFIVNSAYRSIDNQKLIFESNLNSFKKTSKDSAEAFSRTRQLVALPGSSEHHTGLAVDIFSVNGRHRSDFEGTREQVWLNKNLADFGFIIRYPKGKTVETGSVYEPWHIRFVGLPLSTFLKERQLCLEEFYSFIFAGEILEDADGLFMGVKPDQKVFIDALLLNRIQLERVNAQYNLLTLVK